MTSITPPPVPQHPKSTRNLFFTILKWIVGVFLILGALALFAESFLSAVFVLLAGLITIPLVSDKLKEKVPIWGEKRYIRIVAPIVLICMGTIVSGDLKTPKNSISSTSEQQEEIPSPYQSYLNNCKKKTLTDEMRKSREGNLSNFEENKTYKKLVNEAVVSVEYIPLISAISEAVIFSSEKHGFTLTTDTEKRINAIGTDELDFVIRTGCVGMPTQGGYPRYLIDVFERYRKKYGYYGDKKKLISIEGETKEEILSDYDFSALFAVLDPQNEIVLNAVYEARMKGFFSWYNMEESFYPYLTSKEEYFSYIRKVYPKSPYIPKWSEKLSASDLHTAYEANEVLADKQYKDKVIAVVGVIDNIGKDILNDPYITLKTGQYLQGVNCYFSEDQNDQLARLNKGQKITIVGKCDGFIMLNVIIKKCEIEE